MAEWIEILVRQPKYFYILSPLAMAEWIEIVLKASVNTKEWVSASDGGVD